MEHIVIIGNGVAGVTAARYIRKLSDKKITIISAESEHFFSRTALMYVYMGHMLFRDIKPYEDFFWSKNRIDLVFDYVEQVRPANKELKLKSGKTITFDTLILATGSGWVSADWPGKELKGIGGMVSLQDLDALEKESETIKKAVVVGGGLIGIELAEMLRSRGKEVTFLVREDGYWRMVLPKEESEMINAHIGEHHIDMKLNTELKEFVDNGKGRVGAVITNTGEKIECDWVGVTIGVKPAISFLEDSGIELEKGILVNEYFETSVPGIYAIGDCAEFREALPGRNKIEQVWYTGKAHGEIVAHTICGKKTKYQPAPWFNSAKFLDLEWQVYGDVPAELKPGISTLYWQHTGKKKSIRINYETAGEKVTGFNLIGIRYRHIVCERWLMEGKTLSYVLENLGEANFDPEFFKQYESEIVAVYNQNNPAKRIELKKRKGLFSKLQIVRSAKV